MLHEMSNKAFLRLLALIITVIVCIGLLWNLWPLLSIADRYIGAVFLAIILLASIYLIIHAILDILKHVEEVATKRLQRRIEAETHAHRLHLEAEMHAHETLLQRDRFELERHITMTRILPSEHGYAAMLERDPISGYSITQIPYSGRHVQQQQITAPATRNTDPALPLTAQTRVYDMPSQDYILSQLKRNALEVSPGIDARTGELQFMSIPDAVHFKLIGSSGFGKSCLAASLLDQATTLNGPERLQIALLDLEHKTSKLFENVPHVAEYRSGNRRIPLVATCADEVAVQLGYLKVMLNERARLNEYELQQLPIMLIYVEEMLSLQYEVDPKLLAQMLSDLSILALRARKYNLFLLACSQTDYSTKELQAAQKQFRSRIAFAVDSTAARAAGFMSNDLIKENFSTSKKGDGTFVLEYPGYAGICIAPQYDVRQMLLERSTPVQDVWTRQDIHIVESGSTPRETPLSHPRKEVEPATEAGSEEMREVERLRGLGWGKVAIVEKVWNVKKGGSAKYKEACAKYDQIVSELATPLEA